MACREYSIGLRCEIERKDPEKDLISKDPKRAAELAAYFTHAKLQGSHEVLSLRSAMTQFYKLENYATAGIFARRLLEKSQAPAKVMPAELPRLIVQEQLQNRRVMPQHTYVPWPASGVSQEASDAMCECCQLLGQACILGTAGRRDQISTSLTGAFGCADSAVCKAGAWRV